MTAEIIPMPERDKGNGAREALMDVMKGSIARPIADWDCPAVTDYILASLYVAGFVVVPIEK